MIYVNCSGNARMLVRAVLFLAAVLLSQAAWAQNFLANKKFLPTTIGPNSQSQLEFDLFNASPSTLNATVADTLPLTTPAGQLWYDSTDAIGAPVGANCTTGTWTFSDPIAGTRYRTATFTSATVPNNAPAPKPGPDCALTIPVHSGVLSTDTNLVNQVPGANATATGTAGNFQSQDFSATLQVRAPVNATLTKQFNGSGSATIPAGGTATLTLKIANPSPTFALTGVALTDDMSGIGLTVTSGPTFSGCGPAVSSGSTSVLSMTGATIATGGTCTITATVQAPTPGADTTLTNTIPAGAVHSNEASTNSGNASATLTTVTSFTMTKAFYDGSTLRTNDSPAPSGFSSGATSVLVNQPVRMRVYFRNPNIGTALTGGTLVDLLPNDVVNVGTAVGGTCQGSPTMVTAPSGAQTQVTISSITVPPATAGALGSCYIEFWVKPTAAFAQTTNSISSGDVTFAGNVSPTNSTTADLAATASGGTGVGYLGIDKRFWRDGTNGSTNNATNGQTGTGTPMLVQKGEKFWMKVSVWNRTFDQGYTNGTITDTLPLNVTAVQPLNVRYLQNPPSDNGIQNGGCGNGAGTGNVGTVTVTQNGSGQDVVSYSGFDVRNGSGANTSAQTGCFYSIQLVSTTPGDYTNTIAANNVTTTEGATNPSAVNARVAVLSDLDTSKFFDPSVISQGGKTRLYIRFSNKSAAPISGLAVTDNFPSSAGFGTLVVANPANVVNTCDDGSNAAVVTATPGAASVSISAGTVPAASGSPLVPGTCQIAVDVQQSGGASNNTNVTNTIAANSVQNDQGQSNPLAVSATLTKQPMGIQVVKAFAPSNANGGAPVLLRLTFSSTSNPASTGPQDQIALTDAFPAGMVVAPNPNATTTCRKAGPADGSASPPLSNTPADITANPGAPSFTVSGFRFRGTNYASINAVPDNTCEVDIYVIATTTGNKTNLIPAGAIASASGTTNASPSQATLTVLPNTQLSKSFTPASVSVGQTSLLTLTVTNANTSAQNDFGLVDTFPPGMTAAGAATTNCGNGVANASVGGNTLSIAGGDVAANGSCTITVPVLLAAPGPYVNKQSNITADAVINTNGVTATVTAIVPPTASKAFSTSPIQTGSPTTLTITLNNPNASTALSGVSLTDALPAGTYVYVTPTAGNTCGGTFAPAAADTTLTLTGGAIAANGSCQLTVQVTGNPGSYTNVIPAGGLKSDAGDNVDPATALLVIGGPVHLSTTKSGSATGVNGGTAAYTVTYTNSTTFAAPVTIADPLGAYTAFSWSCAGSGGAVCPAASGSGAITAALTMPANSALTYAVTATLPQTGNSATNTSTIGVAPGNPSYTEDPGELGDNTASVTTTMTRSSDITISKTDGVTQVTAGLTTTYTVVVSNVGPSNATGVLVKDAPGAGLTLQGVVCSGASNGAACPVAGVSVANLIGSGIAVDLPASGTLTFTVVALVDPGTTGSVTNVASATHPDSNGGAPRTATDVDTVQVAPGLQIQKTDGVTSVTAGSMTTYTISVTNGGPSSIVGAIVKDAPSSGLTLQSVSCGSANGGAACPSAANVTVAALTGAGIAVDLPVSVTPPAAAVPSGLVFTVVAKIDPAQSADVVNTASVAPPGGQPLTSVDTDTVTQSGDVSVAKVVLAAQVVVNVPGKFRITAHNDGPSNLTGVLVKDVLPSGLLADAVVCSGVSGGATCPDPATVTVAALIGTGLSIDLPADASVSFDLTFHASTLGAFANVATVEHPGDSTPGNNQSTATVTIVAPAVPAPALDMKAMFLLAGLLLFSGGFRRWRRAHMRATTPDA